MKRHVYFEAGLLVATLSCAFAPAYAEITISTSPTQNMSCSNGVCAPTATNANLNAGDLENDLAADNVLVATTGSGGVQANDIVIETSFAWTSASALTLDAHHSVTFQGPVTANGAGAVSLITNDGGSGGTLSFISGGSLSFASTANSLSINGKTCTLASSLPTLAADIRKKPSGRYALSASYDASQDGIYRQSPIKTTFKGTFTGLGNTITNLSIHGSSKKGEKLGLFAEIDSKAVVNSILVKQGTIKGRGNSYAGLIAGMNMGTIFNSSATGAVSAIAGRGVGSVIGGMVGDNRGTLNETTAAVDVAMSGNSSAATAFVGGLAGDNVGTISLSYATGNAIAGTGIGRSSSGGLTGYNNGPVENSYAEGSASIGSAVAVGGLIGYNGYTVDTSYSVGPPTAQGGSVGGSMGDDLSGSDGEGGIVSNVYWDTTSSGVTNLSQGAGNIANDPGITGETTAQLQAGLPSGFDPKIWAENRNVNGGLPYLIANPPQ